MDEDRARARLRAERTEVQILLKDTEAAGQQNRTSENETGDISDPAQPLTEEMTDDAIAASLRDRLAALDRALKRLDDGMYGARSAAGRRFPASDWRPTLRRSSP